MPGLLAIDEQSSQGASPSAKLAQALKQLRTTQLTPVAEALFQQQARDRMSDDYDLRGAWAQQGGGDLGTAHLPDTFKLPNHPTFSDQSNYATPSTPGGTWTSLPSGQWAYVPSQTNYNQFGRTNLEDYFSRIEPDSFLLSKP